MSISAINNNAINVAPNSQTNVRTQNAMPTQTTSPVEKRTSFAPQPIDQSQNSAKNNNATDHQNPQNEVQMLQEAAEKISAHLNLKNSSLEFSVDQNSGKNVVKIVDKTTKEVVRQIPSEEAIHIAQALDELDEIRQGLLLSEQG